MSHVRTKTENVSQKGNVQSCHHGANLSLPTNTSVLSKGKGSNPLHAMQYYVYLLYTKTTESPLFSQHGWAADYGLQEG